MPLGIVNGELQLLQYGKKYRAELDEQIKNRPQEAYNRINNDRRIEVPPDPCKYIS